MPIWTSSEYSTPRAADITNIEEEEDDDEETEGLLDIRNDHFAEEYMSQSYQSIEEVEASIADVKQAILNSDEGSELRKENVHKIIRLQIRLEDLKHRQSLPPLVGIQTHGHTFIAYTDIKPDETIPGVTDVRKRDVIQTRIKCEECRHTIWVSLQDSRHCRECGYSLHTSCMAAAAERAGRGDGVSMRQCVSQKIKCHPDYIMKLCPERTLTSIKFRCMECDRLVDYSLKSEMNPRLCDYTGLWFCSKCHWDAACSIPARVIFNWDFAPRPVSQATKQYLGLMYKNPVINPKDINPRLFAAIQEMGEANIARQKIVLMKKYLSVCRIASEQKLLLLLASRQHFVDDADHYSMQDLEEVKSGALLAFMDGVIKQFSDHIRNCVLCTAKGFICEICAKQRCSTSVPQFIEEEGLVTFRQRQGREMASSFGDSGTTWISNADDPIYPFEESSTICEDCQGVFHRHCFKFVSECPRCQRKVKHILRGEYEDVDDEEAKPLTPSEE